MLARKEAYGFVEDSGGDFFSVAANFLTGNLDKCGFTGRSAAMHWVECVAGVHHQERLIERQAAAVKAAGEARIEAENCERERIKKLEQERVEQLLADADQLRQAQAIRAYVAEVVELYGSQSAPAEGTTFHEWRAWALAQADRIDPVKNGRFLESVKNRP